MLEILVQGVGVHSQAVIVAGVRGLLVQHDETAGIFHRQQTHHKLIEDCEDGGVRADSERERQDRDACEQRAPRQCAEGELQVGQESTLWLFYGRRRLRLPAAADQVVLNAGL